MKLKFLVIICFIVTLMHPSFSYAENDKNFCLVSIPIKDNSGISVAEKWRQVSDITVFENSPYALFFSFSSYPVMRLDGYKLIPVDIKELPYGGLDDERFFYDQSQNIYGTSRHGKRVFKMDSETGKFHELSEKKAQSIKSELEPIFHKKSLIGDSNQYINFNRNDGKIYLDDKEIPAVYAGKFESGKMNLAHPMYYPEFKEIFAYGYILKREKSFPWLNDKEYGTFTWKDNQWTKIRLQGEEEYHFSPTGYSKLLDKIVFSGSKHDEKFNGLNFKSYYYGRDGQLKQFGGASPQGTARPYDLQKGKTTLLMTGKGLYKINKDMELASIELPQALKTSVIRHLVEIPESDAILIIAEDGIYIMDNFFNISKEPIFEMSIFGDIIEIWDVQRIPAREEVFIPSSKGLFLLLDKRLSDSTMCDK